MQLNQIEPVRAQPAQAALDTFQKRCRRPIFAANAARMAALRKEVIVRPPIGDRLADQLFAAFIAFAGVDDIKPGIQGAFEQASHRFFGGSFKANLGPAETKDRDLHIGFAKVPSFHFVNCRAVP